MDSIEQLSEQLVLGLLADARDGFLSGEALSDKLGLPRTVVFRRIDDLRSKGYQIDSVPRRGYRLTGVPDRLTSLELAPLLGSLALGASIHAFDLVDSTNEVARALAEDGAEHGTLVVAEAQRRGRGRRGRSWLSPPKANLYFSLVLRPELPIHRVHELTLLAAVAVAEVLQEAGFEAAIKWPNDLMIRGRKVGGILTELTLEDDRVRFVVLGIGLNVNLDPIPEEIARFATSLSLERGEPLPRAFLLAALLAGLETWLEKDVALGFEPVRQRWRELSSTLGRQVQIDDGPAAIEGVAVDLAVDGALLVRDAAGVVHRVVAGDVRTPTL